jgi:hypothetical protein
MIAVPSDAPVTIPEVAPTGATNGLTLLQVPKGVPSVKPLVSPRQIPKVPEIGNGTAFTVTGILVLQPVGSV